MIVKMNEMQRLQENFSLIRRAVGWTAQEFADKIGVSKMTISNIETGRYPLTKLQYIGIRSVLDAEIYSHKEETEMLATLLDMLVDHPENYESEEKDELIQKAQLISPSILAGTATRKEASKEWMKIAGTICAASLTFLALNPHLVKEIGSWIYKTMASKKK